MVLLKGQNTLPPVYPAGTIVRQNTTSCPVQYITFEDGKKTNLFYNQMNQKTLPKIRGSNCIDNSTAGRKMTHLFFEQQVEVASKNSR